MLLRRHTWAISRHDMPIEYDDIGRGPNVVVLVHGHPFNRSMWWPQVEYLRERGWRVIVPDLRGYGNSKAPAGKTTLDVFADDIVAVLDALGIGGVVIGGLSMGGQIAMEFCRTRAARVRGLILAATFPQDETPDGRRERQQMAGRLLRQGMERYATEVLPKMLARSSIERCPELAQHVLAMMQNTDPLGAAAALRGRAVRPSYEATLASLLVPSLIIAGSEDSFTTRADAERMRELLRNSELVWLPGIGHMPNLEAPEEFNAAMWRLLESIP